jgi:signal transduction histidine kinase
MADLTAPIAAIRRLHLLGLQAMGTNSMEALLQSAADSVAELLPADRVSVFTIDRAARGITGFAKGGPGQGSIVAVGFDELWSGLTGWVLREKMSALSPKEGPDPRESSQVAQRRVETDCGGIVVVPLQLNGKVLGTMTAINRRAQRDFTAVDVELMEMFADYCVVVLESTRRNLELSAAQSRLDRSNEDLMLENDRKDRLFMILSHDLRGPIGNISTMLNMLFTSELDDEDRAALLEGARSAAEQSFGLTDNVLGWIRGQFAAKSGIAARLDIAALLERVSLWLKPVAEHKQISVRIEATPMISALSDEGVLATIVRNILSNALKYSREESEIVVRAYSRSDWIVIEVEDHGVGMEPEALSRVFGKTKVESTPGTSGEAGNGVGLMFCADLAKSVGGRLEADSTPGLGSTFRLMVPEVVDGDLAEQGSP